VEDEEISEILKSSFEKSGVECYTETSVVSVEVKGEGQVHAVLKKGDQVVELDVNRVLVAAGMVPNSKGLGLEEAGVKLDSSGFIQVDKFQQSSLAGVYAIGDCTGKQMLAHKASAEAETAVSHAFGGESHPVNYGQIPGCTYCQPQVASVGLTEKACKEKGLEITVGKFPFSANGKARAIGHTDGMVKLIFGKEYGELLGAHIIGSEATELLAELGLAMKLEATWEEIAATIHGHPTLSEAVLEAALDSQGKAIHI
jgi:dihydrolipoamide dehydrogenase